MATISPKQRAFTLIEVLAVIAIIGLLSTLLTPAVGSAMAKARKMRVSNNLRQIAMGYGAYVNGGGSLRKLNEAATVADWAAVLAADGGIADASIYVIPEDYLVAGSSRPIPRQVLASGSTAPNAAFRDFPLGFVIITGLSPDDDPATTPLAYSRGLDRKTGQWRQQSGDDGGIYGQSGGFVVFLDGHVSWFRSLSEDGGELTDFSSGSATGDIGNAVRPGARAINWRGTVWEKTKSAN